MAMAEDLERDTEAAADFDGRSDAKIHIGSWSEKAKLRLPEHGSLRTLPSDVSSLLHISSGSGVLLT